MKINLTRLPLQSFLGHWSNKVFLLTSEPHLCGWCPVEPGTADPWLKTNIKVQPKFIRCATLKKTKGIRNKHIACLQGPDNICTKILSHCDNSFWDFYFYFFKVLFSLLLHLPPLRQIPLCRRMPGLNLGLQPRTVITFALAVRRSNLSARSPHTRREVLS